MRKPLLPLLLILFTSLLIYGIAPVESQTWGSPSAAYLQVSVVDFNGGGKNVNVSPGAAVTGHVGYQFWDNGNPTAIWQIWIMLDYGNPINCLWSGVPGAQPGHADIASWTFPTLSSGAHTIYIMPIALYSCDQLSSISPQTWPSEVAIGQITVTQPPPQTQTVTTTNQPPPPPPTCPDGQYWNGAQCVCPSGQQWNGQQCVTPPPPPPQTQTVTATNQPPPPPPQTQTVGGQTIVVTQPPPQIITVSQPQNQDFTTIAIAVILGAVVIAVAVIVTRRR